jgi:hypothetical protein
MTNDAVRPATQAHPAVRAKAGTDLIPQRWLLLVHQLPARPTSLRVRIWRRLQQLGAIAVKQAVYVLPDSSNSREDFEWLKAEIDGAGGEATVFAADTVDTWSNDALVEEFRRSREEAYRELARDAEGLVRRSGGGRGKASSAPSHRAIQQLRERLSAIERIDFFGSAGRDRVLTLIRQAEERTSRTPRAGTTGSGPPGASYRGKLWVTRPRPGVDRMASAWLIRRFIDPDARFDFVADRAAAPAPSVPFDMFGVEFTHRGELCTFELLCQAFQVTDAAIARVAALVHDLDLKDGRFGSAEAPAIGFVIDGLRLAEADDQKLLERGMTLFEALYRAFAQASLTSGPRPVATRARSRARVKEPARRR